MFHLEAEEKLKSLHWVISSIYKISDENIASLVNLSTWIMMVFTCSEKLKQVKELAVDISTDSDWCSHGLDIGLFQKNLFDFFAYKS